MKKNGILTLLFAFIPGAGQMYQGYMKRGLSLVLMAAAIGMASVLIPPVVFTLLVVFMYSFFDTFNLRAQISMGTAPEDDYLGRLLLLTGRCSENRKYYSGMSMVVSMYLI